MKRFRDIIESVDTPENENVLWLDTSNEDAPILKYFRNGKWVQVAGGGGPAPGPTTLTDYYYYGALENRVTISTIDISSLLKTKDSESIGNINKVYYYIAICNNQNIISVITHNQEDITSQFSNIGTFNISGKTYTLYEFFLDTLIPLNVYATITITEN